MSESKSIFNLMWNYSKVWVSKEQDFLSFKAAPDLNAALFASQILNMLVPFYADCAHAVPVTHETAVIWEERLDNGRAFIAASEQKWAAEEKPSLTPRRET